MMRPLILCLSLLIFISGVPDVCGQKKDTVDYTNWNFRLNPYFWFIGFDGEIHNSIFELPANF